MQQGHGGKARGTLHRAVNATHLPTRADELPQPVDPAGPYGIGHLDRLALLASSQPLVPDLTLTLDLLDDAIVVLHENGRIIYRNHAARALATAPNLTANSADSLCQLGPGEPWAGCQQLLGQYRKTKLAHLERQVHDPGAGRTWSLRLYVLAYLGVQAKRLVLVLRDISPESQLRDRLQEDEVMAATGTLLAGATHQAKNALFGLSSTLDAFCARFGRNGPEEVYLHNLRVGIVRIQTLMRDLLDYANPNLSESCQVSITAVLRQAVSSCHALAGERQVEIVLEECESDIAVTANPARLVRAVENLVENAVQHSNPGNTVRLRLRHHPDSGLVQCEVIDQGPGFPPEHMQKLLTPFFTLRPGGTGLGLTIAQKIVADLGGAVELANGASGGARVSVLLPSYGDLTPHQDKDERGQK